MRENNYVLAADVGGTNLRVAAVDGDGNIIHQNSDDTPQSGDAGDLIDSVVGNAEACITSLGNPPHAFGLAIAALVNTRAGRVFSSPNLPELNGLELAEIISSRLGVPVLIDNDATAAAIGERWLGASKNVDNSIFVTLGTGIGGGLILDGRPYRGADGTAGEIGHILVEPGGETCGCGSRGCVEQYASATALVRIANELAANGTASETNQVDRFRTGKDVFDAALRGDTLAMDAFGAMGRYLGVALADLINVLNPEMIVIGGGGAGGWDFFVESVRSAIQENAFPYPASRAELVRASLVDNAGILGAARVALDHVCPS